MDNTKKLGAFTRHLREVAAGEGILTEAAEALIDAARVIEEQEEELRKVLKMMERVRVNETIDKESGNKSIYQY